MVATFDTTCVTMETTQDTIKASAEGGTLSKEWRLSPIQLLNPEHCRYVRATHETRCSGCGE